MSYIFSQNQNQLIPTLLVGQVNRLTNPNVIPMKLNPSSTGYFQAGTVLKLITGAAGEILADVSTGVTDGPVVGVLLHSPKTDKPVKGNVVEVGTAETYVWMLAGGVIQRGNTVAGTPGVSGTTDPEVIATTTTGNYPVGIAQSEATAEGQLVLVRVFPSKL